MKKDIGELWERRGRLFKTSKKAVMEQAFPSVVNNYIEGIHVTEIGKLLNTKVTRCLDVGCGYGRLAKVIARKNHKLFIYGIDIAPTFVELFNGSLKKRGKAIVGDMRKLPYRDNFFDVIWSIVSFMYLENRIDQKQGMRELFRVLKPEGKIIFIEPNRLGVDIVRLWGLVPFLYRKLLGISKAETFGTAFSTGRIDSLVRHAGGKVLYKRGYPMFTLFLLPNIILGRFIPFVTRILLAVVTLVDKIISHHKFSYFVTYVAIKKA